MSSLLPSRAETQAKTLTSIGGIFREQTKEMSSETQSRGFFDINAASTYALTQSSA